MQAPLTTSRAVDNLLLACEQRGAAGSHGPARAAAWRAHAPSLADMPPLEPMATDSPLVLAIRSKSDVISSKHPLSKLVITKPEQKIVGVAPAMRKSHGESWTPFDADPEDMYRQKLSNQTSRMTSQGNQNMFKVCAILRLTSSPASCFHGRAEPPLLSPCSLCALFRLCSYLCVHLGLAGGLCWRVTPVS